ncbi:Imm1 family immunity protein [Actinokineospora inagensis]|uniref:Imm1 family immunity protein n=1 Tax=Actinokineospora inagensis TaxID=103730 RepID=UPI000406B056|nr:Imm1 family immunity protein [Actinokineospora inagensis]
MIVTATLTTGISRVTRGMADAIRLVDEILRTDHIDWETILLVGDVEFHSTRDGPYPDQQLRVSVRPTAGWAALNHTDHYNPDHPIANTFNPTHPPPDVALIFNGSTGSVFPRTAAIPVPHVRQALIEWLNTRKRPVCVQWRPFDDY